MVWSDGWSDARKKAWPLKDRNPNGYLYRFNVNALVSNEGDFNDEEKLIFMNNVKKLGVNHLWGLWSRNIKKRVGYTCQSYWGRLIKKKQVIDLNYYETTNNKGKMVYKQLKGKCITEEFRRYAFEIIEVCQYDLFMIRKY